VVVQPHLCNVLGTCFWCSGESVALNSCRLYGGRCAAEAMKRSHERYIVKDFAEKILVMDIERGVVTESYLSPVLLSGCSQKGTG